MKSKQLLAVIEAQKEIIGKLEHVLGEIEEAGLLAGNERLILLKKLNMSLVQEAKAKGFDAIISEL